MDTRETRRSLIEERKNLHEENGRMTNTSILMRRAVEAWSRVKSLADASAYSAEGKSLIMLQFN